MKSVNSELDRMWNAVTLTCINLYHLHLLALTELDHEAISKDISFQAENRTKSLQMEVRLVNHLTITTLHQWDGIAWTHATSALTVGNEHIASIG
jgi:hypothetical protein